MAPPASSVLSSKSVRISLQLHKWENRGSGRLRELLDCFLTHVGCFLTHRLAWCITPSLDLCPFLATTHSWVQPSPEPTPTCPQQSPPSFVRSPRGHGRVPRRLGCGATAALGPLMKVTADPAGPARAVARVREDFVEEVMPEPQSSPRSFLLCPVLSDPISPPHSRPSCHPQPGELLLSVASSGQPPWPEAQLSPQLMAPSPPFVTLYREPSFPWPTSQPQAP